VSGEPDSDRPASRPGLTSSEAPKGPEGSEIDEGAPPPSFDLTSGAGELDEDAVFLREIDWLREELSPRLAGQGLRPTVEENPSGVPFEVAPTGGLAATERWGAPSPYLEERLTVARAAVRDLTGRASGLDETVRGLRESLDTIDREIERVSEELGFLRAQEASSAAFVAPAPAVRPARSKLGRTLERPPTVPPARDATLRGEGFLAAQEPRTGTFRDFTVARYNRTVGDLHGRRRAVGWWTVVLAATISAGLLLLTLEAREPMPAIYLAVLPLVWMIPVPFFVAAFRGAQRVLRANRFELREEA
jgi:hypothetical protein